jgi:hypothetical protein
VRPDPENETPTIHKNTRRAFCRRGSRGPACETPCARLLAAPPLSSGGRGPALAACSSFSVPTEGNATATTPAQGGSGFAFELSPDQSVTVNPSIALTKPIESTLNGYQFTLNILGYGEAEEKPSDGENYSAPPGVH